MSSQLLKLYDLSATACYGNACEKKYWVSFCLCFGYLVCFISPLYIFFFSQSHIKV